MKDLIKREDAIGAIEGTDWYHQNRNKDMVSGANSDEHQAWYKAEDVYKALKEVPSAEITRDDVMQYCKSRLLVLATVEFIKHQYRIGFEDGKASALGCHYLSRGKEQMMRCVDCEQHDCVVGTHFCNYKGKSGRRKPRRISEEDAYKDVPCEYIEEQKGADDDTD